MLASPIVYMNAPIKVKRNRWQESFSSAKYNYLILSNKFFKGMSSAAAVTDSSFEQEVLQSDVPVLVDFWAPWCGPCRMVAPIVDEISKDFEGKIKVCKLNTDENPNVASQYGIRSIPTLMIFKGGQKVDTVVGAVPKATLSGTISKHI
ncbi:Thiol-disulfide isomerase and thioredoxin [Prochlorococcus marinus str. MIT 9211]|uniref:Thioredoxin n=2 Tax=Prochlorococcus marinus TaxID=1219 RepID=A9BB48_PROM4|nr:Thiol-disulfide isomerase and thioredoxin [Prochlorococcus marinus str. MIT 9211]